GEGSGTPTEPHHTPSPEAQQTSYTTPSSPTLPSVTTAPIPTVTLSDTPTLTQYTRRARIAQSSALPPVADEPASPLRDVSKGEACPTYSGFEADQDKANIAKSSTLPYDSAPRVPSPAADEDEPASPVRDNSKGEACPTDSGFIADQDRATIAKSSTLPHDSAPRVTSPAADEGTPRVTSHAADDGSIEVGPTASPVVTSYSRRKGKKVMVESDTPKKQRLQEQIDAQVARELEEQQEREDMRMNEQIARDAELARIHAEEDLQGMIDSLDKLNKTIAKYLQEYQDFASDLPLEKRIELIKVARIHAEEELQGMIDSLEKSNETIAKYLQEYQDFASELPLEKRIELISDLVKYQDNYSKVYKFQSQQRRPITKKQKKEYYIAMIRNNLRWKKQVKKQKSSEEAPEIKTSTKEFTEEKMKEMMQFVPVEDVYVQALQIKHPIIDWKIHTKGQRSYWQIIRLGGNSACYQFFCRSPKATG
nr:hypothetical protein [Tanacetum cinerariifolium]